MTNPEDDVIKAPARSAQKVLSVDLGTELKTAWLSWCAERNLPPGAAARSLIENTVQVGLNLGDDHQPPMPTVAVIPAADNGPAIGHEIYFTPSEHRAVLAACAGQGFGLHQYVVAAVRAALTLAPTYGQAELEALTRSNAGLADMRISLGSLLRNAAPTAELASRITALQNDLRTHCELVSQTMAAGTRRWQLKPDHKK